MNRNSENGPPRARDRDDRPDEAEALEKSWREVPRWAGVRRAYPAEEVVRLRGSLRPLHLLSRRGAEKLWSRLQTSGSPERRDGGTPATDVAQPVGGEAPPVRALGALTGAQAVQMVQAGLESIYVSGWQVAGDMNTAGQTYPDQSLYPADSVPRLVARINAALRRADQIEHLENGRPTRDWFVPIVADAEAGFGGVLNAFELTRALIEAGAAGVHFEDQLSSYKKCGHMGGKVLAPTGEAIHKLIAARLAADVAEVPLVLVARTDAGGAELLANDIDERDHPFLTGERTSEGFFRVRAGLDQAVARGLAYAPWADVVWCETRTPDLDEARRFAEAILAEYPGKLLAYNCSPSFNWSANLDAGTIGSFQRELGAMGYRYQFVTLAGFHSLNAHMFELARGYAERGMSAYAELQDAEARLEREAGYRALRHQSFVGAGWFDRLTELITGGQSTTRAMQGSTEVEQFRGSATSGGDHRLPAR